MKQIVIAALLLFVAATASDGVFQPLGAHYQVLIPAAGSTQGANNTFFRSDISIINLQSRTQSIRLEWLAQNGANLVRTIELGALTGIRQADFVAEVLGTSGLGSIIVTAMAGNAVDTSGRLYVASRVWTPQPGTNGGTTSQSFPVIPVQGINTQTAALFTVGGGPAPDEAANYRVNVGIVNLDPVNAQTYSVFSPPGVGINVTVGANSMTQFNATGVFSPTAQIIVQNLTPTATRSNNWITYQSTVNNITGDAWTEMGVAGTATGP
jgi:hypothetical protein